MKNEVEKKGTDAIFRLSLIIKGVDAAFEVLGGLALTTPTKLSRLVLVLSQHEAFKHHQVLAGRLDKLSDSLTTHASLGEAAYLMIHGLTKLILIIAIFRGSKWGYVGLIAILTIFSSIELVRAITAHEVVTGALGAFDLAVAWIIFVEYRRRYLTPKLSETPA